MQRIKNVPFPLRISEELKQFLTQQAINKGMTRNTFIANLLWEYKEKIENEQKNR